MHIIQHSTAFRDLANKSPLVQARFTLAESRLRLDVHRELVMVGIVPDEEIVNSIIQGLPPAMLAQLIEERA